jgi:uncharacterized protein
MKNLLRSDLRLDWKVAVLTVTATLLVMVDYYYRLTPSKLVDYLLLFFAIPMVVILLVFRESPRQYGFQLGDWRAGLTLTALGILLIAPVLWLLGRGEVGMREYYAWQLHPGLLVNTFASLFGWEFLFRGYLLFGYARRFGPEAIWLQAVPFALAHLGKPDVETLSTIFGGFVFGWVAWRTRSFLYPFLIHWFVTTFTILAAAGVLG